MVWRLNGSGVARAETDFRPVPAPAFRLSPVHCRCTAPGPFGVARLKLMASRAPNRKSQRPLSSDATRRACQIARRPRAPIVRLVSPVSEGRIKLQIGPIYSEYYPGPAHFVTDRDGRHSAVTPIFRAQLETQTLLR